MKLLTVALMLLGVVLAQTKPISNSAARSKLNQGATIYIGVNLQLRMPRDAVIAQIAADYKVVKLQGDGDDWLVEDKETSTNVIGSLGFTAGKLTYASRSWTQGEEDNFGFAQALWGAMTQMNKEDQHNCFFDVPTSRSPTAETNDVRLYCGSKRIDIQTINVFNGTGKGRYASIAEVLSSEKNR